MKKELVKIINKKLSDINENIKSLEELNTKIGEENDRLSFLDKIIGLFKEDDQNNLLSFAKIDKDEFLSVLEIVGDDVRNLFNGESCNYEGLVYLINGINSGVSITLTDEQKNGIEYFIKSMEDKKTEMLSTVDGYELMKSKYEVSDVSELTDRKNKYSKLLEDVDNGNYIKDVDLLKDAITYSNLTPEETISILSFVLEYNVDVYKEGKTFEDVKEEKKEEPKEEIKEETKEEKVEEKQDEALEEETEPAQEEKKEEEFSFRQVESDNLFDLPNITFDDEPMAVKEEVVENNDITEPAQEKEEVTEEVVAPMVEPEEPKEEPVEVKQPEENKSDDEVEIPSELTYVPANDEDIVVSTPTEVKEEEVAIPVTPEVTTPQEEVKEEPVETEVSETVAPVVEPEETKEEIDSDFKDVIDSKVDYETREKQEEEKTSTRELHKVFGKYGIEENVILNELIDGNVTEYQRILDILKDRNILDYFKNNKELLIETLLNSNSEVIDRVLKIVKEDLSVDEEDYGITLKIVINTIPSVFIKDGGNYDNFISNIDLFKKLGINLINLFDFSKEVLIADNEAIQKNLEVIRKYGFDINYKNAKYFLLIPNIDEKLDYYIESVYEDKTKKETFDGINYIKDYAAKLNVVTDETIKRLRYASSTGSKVFGNKPGSLAGEITNLKVHALSISDEYMNTFFNNGFNNITPDEVREYTKLARNSTNVGDYSDELDKLNTYHNGLRYVIDGINVSYNKVARNYSILRSYGIDAKKALQFAVCYNLVITKDEYNKLSELLDKVGGNA